MRTQINKRRKRRKYNQYHRDTKKSYRILQFYAKKLHNLVVETDKCLETHKLLRLNQEETDNLNRLITSSEIELVIKDLPANRSAGWDSFKGGIQSNMYKKELVPIPSKLFQKIDEEGRLSNLF